MTRDSELSFEPSPDDLGVERAESAPARVWGAQAELRRLHAAATPTPWGIIPPNGPQGPYPAIWNPEKGYIVIDRVLTDRIGPDGEPVQHNSAYIVAACNAVPGLLDRIEELEAENGTTCIDCGKRWKPLLIGICPMCQSDRTAAKDGEIETYRRALHEGHRDLVDRIERLNEEYEALDVSCSEVEARAETYRRALVKIKQHPIANVVHGRPAQGIPSWPSCQDIAREALGGEA